MDNRHQNAKNTAKKVATYNWIICPGILFARDNNLIISVCQYRIVGL